MLSFSDDIDGNLVLGGRPATGFVDGPTEFVLLAIKPLAELREKIIEENKSHGSYSIGVWTAIYNEVDRVKLYPESFVSKWFVKNVYPIIVPEKLKE